MEKKKEDYLTWNKDINKKIRQGTIDLEIKGAEKIVEMLKEQFEFCLFPAKKNKFLYEILRKTLAEFKEGVAPLASPQKHNILVCPECNCEKAFTEKDDRFELTDKGKEAVRNLSPAPQLCEVCNKESENRNQYCNKHWNELIKQSNKSEGKS